MVTLISPQITALVFAAIQLALLISWAKNTRPNTKLSVASSAINLAVAMEIVVLSWVEDERSVRPSSLLAIYLLFTLLFDVVQTRTLWLSPGNLLVPSLFTASVAAKTVMVLFESLGKQKYLTGPYQGLPPESTSGIVNRSFMWWLNRLFFRGFRSLLTTEDLDHLDKPLKSAATAPKALRAWALRLRCRAIIGRVDAVRRNFMQDSIVAVGIEVTLKLGAWLNIGSPEPCQS